MVKKINKWRALIGVSCRGVLIRFRSGGVGTFNGRLKMAYIANGILWLRIENSIGNTHSFLEGDIIIGDGSIKAAKKKVVRRRKLKF